MLGIYFRIDIRKSCNIYEETMMTANRTVIRIIMVLSCDLVEGRALFHELAGEVMAMMSRARKVCWNLSFKKF